MACAAPSLGVLAAALACVGVTSVAAQVLVPFASSLAREEERGRVVGRVMSGLLLGILLARTVAGLAAEIGGWRLIYGLAAAAMLTLALVLRRALPLVDAARAAGLRRACWPPSATLDPRGAACCAAGWPSASSRWRASAGCGP